MRIERSSRKGITTIRLIGSFQSEDLGELTKARVASTDAEIVFDLKEVTLVDVEIVRFLALSKENGVKLVNCAQYIRDWMRRERS